MNVASVLLLTRLNASFASARHFRYDSWYIAGGRAVEALSANFGGLRKTFAYQLNGASSREEREKARAVFEYMRPLPKLGKSGHEYNPLSNSNTFDFFEEGGKDVKYEVEIEEAEDRRATKKAERNEAVKKAKEAYNTIEITYEDVKEYLSTPLGLKVLEWAGIFLKEDQANIMFDLFEEIRMETYDELDKSKLLDANQKTAFVEFTNINRVLREIEYFETNPEKGKEAFYTVGLGGTTYEAQIRYIPVENIDNGTRELTDAFEAIEKDTDFDKNIKHFLQGFIGIKDSELTDILDDSSYYKNCTDHLKTNVNAVGLSAKEIDDLFVRKHDKKSVLREFARIMALAKFTPLSKEERKKYLGEKDATKAISTLITEENQREYINQKHSHTMPDGSVKDVVPVAYIFKSSDPENVVMLNVGGISATGTFLKCGNWSTLAQEQMTLFIQEQRQTVLEGGGGAMARTVDPGKPQIETEYTRLSTGIAGSGRVLATPAPGVPENDNKVDDNGLGTGAIQGPPEEEGSFTTEDPDYVPGSTFKATPGSIGATTGTLLGTEAPEGVSQRRGSDEPKNNHKTKRNKPKKKKTKEEASDES